MDDAISRSAVLKEIDWAIDLAMDDEMHHAMCTLGERFKEIPALDAVPVVHAKWTGGKYYNGTYGYEKTCTNCKKEYVVVYGYLFCPYCGARMDGEAE